MKIYLYPLLLLCITIIFMGCNQQSIDIQKYGPRWTDYEDWGKLDLGMSKKDVLGLLGEPYLTTVAFYKNGKTYQNLIFKFRTKLYDVKRIAASTTTGVINIKGIRKSDDPFLSITTETEVKPEKFAQTNVWGDYFDLDCLFENNILVKWSSPQSIEQPSGGKDSLTNDHSSYHLQKEK